MNLKKLVQKYDPENQFNVLVNTFSQVEYAWENDFDLSLLTSKKFNSVIVSGLGGSAISGDLMQNFLQNELKIPYSVNRNYTLPSFINKDSLLIASSYSGNTEETLEVLNKAIEIGCSIVCITTGGKMREIANQKNLPLVLLKEGYQPRYSLGLSFFSLLKVLQKLNIIADQSDIVLKIQIQLKRNGIEFAKENSTPYKIAEELIGFIPIIYSVSDVTNALGNRFKCQLNENSKVHAFCNYYPELNHNEIVGWETVNANLFNTIVINVWDEVYHPQVKKRFQISNNLIHEKGVHTIEIKSELPTFKERLFYLVYLTDWISYYLAILRGQDPSEIDNIHALKKRLTEL